MRIAIIGPTAIETVAAAGGWSAEECRRLAAQAGEELAARGHELVVVPDRGVGLIAAEAYRRAGGPKVIGLIPRGGSNLQARIAECEQHRDLCDVVVDDLTWDEQHPRLCQLADALLCIGLSCGTIAEIAWTKWTGYKPVFVLRELVSAIPPEIMAETNVQLVGGLEEVWDRISG